MEGWALKIGGTIKSPLLTSKEKTTQGGCPECQRPFWAIGKGKGMAPFEDGIHCRTGPQPGCLRRDQCVCPARTRSLA